jgi:two-component SAPR family response regulator
MEFRYKILAIDDEPNIRVLLSEDLGETYDVITSTGEENVLETIEKHAPHIIILDIKLSNRKNGLDVLTDIRKAYSDMPVILHTAYHDYQHDSRVNITEYYVVKSTDATQLKETILKIIQTLQPL